MHIHSRLPNAQGKVTITALDTDKIDYLISAFCTEKNIQHRNEFVLQNITDDILPNVRMLSSCNVSNGDVLYLVLRSKYQQYTILKANFMYPYVQESQPLANCARI